MSLSQIASKLAPAKSPGRRVPALFPTLGLSFAVAFISGLYYYLVPPGFNWGLSQAVLIVHMLAGLVALGCFIPFVIRHQRAIEGRSLWLLAPWLALKRGQKEPAHRFWQRLAGHGLTWSLVLAGVSGLLVTVPAWLWYAGVVWLPGYLGYRVANTVHLVAGLAAAGLLAWHLVRHRGGRRPE